MRYSVAAVALLSREYRGEKRWLVRWNRKWERYHLVGGHREEGETFRECLLREINEELHLVDQLDFVVDPAPVIRVEDVAWSASAKEETKYTFTCFRTRLVRTEAYEHIDEDARCRWVSESEILDSRCTDGSPVSPTTRMLLERSESM